MTDPTRIRPEMVDAYRTTEYRVAWGGRSFVLRIGVASADLRALYAETRRATALFITADNPGGARCSDAANAAAHARLHADLAALRLPFAAGEGAGTDPANPWPAEKSFLVLGIDKEAARHWGHRFGQNAIVWAGPDAVPELVLLR